MPFYKKYTVDESFFKSIDSEQKAYALGFLLTDGGIDKRGKYFYWQSTDIDVLEKLKRIVSYTGPIIRCHKEKDYHKDCWMLKISNRSMVKDLNGLGIQNNKVNNLWIDLKNPVFQWHFIRGLVDGDGTFRRKVGLSRINQVKFKYEDSSNLLVLGFQKFLSSEGIFVNIRTFKRRENWKRMYKIEFSGINAVAFLNKVYSFANIYMDRKYESYQEINHTRFSTRFKKYYEIFKKNLGGLTWNLES